MKVLFLNPPYFPMFSRESRSPCVTKSSTLYWPMFMAYAAGCVEADGNEILVIDSPAMDLDLQATLDKIKDFRPELAVLNTSTPSINNDMRVGKAIKEAAAKDGYKCDISMMGTHATAEPLEILEREMAIDYVISGEADYTARELVRVLRAAPAGTPITNEEKKKILGISWRKGEEMVRNPERPKIENLDTLPWVSKVYRKHLFSCYKRYFYGANINPLIVILSGRGCPFRCTYCVIPQTMTGHTYRKRSIKDVVDEMAYIKAEFPDLGEIFFEDDTFTAHPTRTAELCQEVINRGLKVTWSANARADVKFEVLDVMKKAGCRELCVGFESSSMDVLKNVKKGLAKGMSEKFMESANKAGILIHGCFMVGNLGDTKDTLNDTLVMAKQLNPNTAQFYPIMAYPGTTAYDEARSRGELASEDYDKWLDKDGQHNTTVIRKGLTSQELVDFCDRARREFYLRPAYIYKQAVMALTNSRERYRVMRGAGTLVKHLFKKHGAPQEASTYASAAAVSATAKARPASSHSHSHQETLGEANAPAHAEAAAAKAEAAIKA
jgi:anaerobic magnesium-protoporphyrin IX monomethyl ester cyclase